MNFDKLTAGAQRAARDAGLSETCSNPFQSIVVRMVETLFAVEEARRIIEGYAEPSEPSVPYTIRAGEGHGASEAPRGLLYHRYAVDDEGYIRDAQIAPPTAQNQLSMEDDLLAVIEANSGMSDEDLRWRLEQSIRNYDPCISCATHFLKLEVDRG
jgi:coenzyme F420-reducing hydrogenase alpha subunit